jgi:hypothetical protein
LLDRSAEREAQPVRGRQRRAGFRQFERRAVGLERVDPEIERRPLEQGLGLGARNIRGRQPLDQPFGRDPALRNELAFLDRSWRNYVELKAKYGS